MQQIEVTTLDNKIYTLDPNFKSYSKFLGNIMDESEANETAKLSVNVESREMERIIEFYKIYSSIPKYKIPMPLNYSKKFEEQIPGEMYQFITSINFEELIPLINACNYLVVSKCLKLCCAYFATYLYDKTPDEIRGILNLEDDLTPTEKEKIKEELKFFE